MSDIPPRRAMTQHERETLGSVEEISRALQEPANSAPGRNPEPAPREISDAEWDAFLQRERASPTRRKLDVFARVMRTMDTGKKDVSRVDYLIKAFSCLLEETTHLERQIHVLSDRPELKYVGVWRDGHAYRLGNLCTHDGSLWHCNAATMSRPGAGGDWQLCAKRGKDGADAEAVRRSTRSGR